MTFEEAKAKLEQKNEFVEISNRELVYRIVNTTRLVGSWESDNQRERSPLKTNLIKEQGEYVDLMRAEVLRRMGEW